MQNEFVHLEDVAILFSEMSELECTHRGCTEGPGGGKFKTPALPPEIAFAILKMHQENCTVPRKFFVFFATKLLLHTAVTMADQSPTITPRLP